MTMPKLDMPYLMPGFGEWRARARYDWLCAHTSWASETGAGRHLVTAVIDGTGESISRTFIEGWIHNGLLRLSDIDSLLCEMQDALWTDAIEKGIVPETPLPEGT